MTTLSIQALTQQFAQDLIALIQPRVEQQLFEEVRQILLRDLTQGSASLADALDVDSPPEWDAEPKTKKKAAKVKATPKAAPKVKATRKHPPLVLRDPAPTKTPKKKTSAKVTAKRILAVMSGPTPKSASQIAADFASGTTSSQIVEVSPGRFELTLAGHTYRATRKRDLYRYLDRYLNR